MLKEDHFIKNNNVSLFSDVSISKHYVTFNTHINLIEVFKLDEFYL